MRRDYFIYDADGQGTLTELDLPVLVGGINRRGIVIPGLPDDELVAIIALAEGHAYIQPAKSAPTIFHNDERLGDSAWLKSGDRVQIAGSILSWEIQGDRVLINVQPQKLDIDQLRPPKQTPVAPQNDKLPVPGSDSRHSGGKQLRRSVVAFVSVLLLIAVYLLSATSVVITTEPESAVIELNGFPPAISLGGSHLALPGQHQLIISSQGYRTKDIELDIKSGPALNLHYLLDELPGVININTDPPAQLQLFVDEVESPATARGSFEIARGAHMLRVESLRFLSKQLEFEVEGYGAEQMVELSLEPAWAVVSINSSPAGAEVLVDDLVVGLTPLQSEIHQGQHKIRVQKPGFKPVISFHIVEAGQDFSMDEIQLEPVDGRLSVSSRPAGASILDGDRFLGTTPATIALTAETEHRLRLSKAGYVTTEQQVRLTADEERLLDVQLETEYGTVFLKVQPAGASLKVNGKSSATGSGRLRLQTIKNTLLISKPGYVSQTISVTPTAGVSQSMNISLVTVKQEQARVQEAATPAVVTTVTGQTLQLVEPQDTLHMGASRRDAGRRSNENQRLVKLQRPFYLSHKEVTNAEFRRFIPKHDSGRIDSAALNGEQQPVVNVSWDDAARYCNWLSKQQGLPLAYREENGQMLAVSPMTTGYRLPTEAEWAWVARRRGFESEQRYPWQGGFPPAAVNGNYADARIADTLADVVPAYDDGYRGTAPVGSFPAWPDGFYDMGGNSAEWMHDIYALYPGEATHEVTDPMGPPTGKHHVVRGAGWRDGSITELRLSFRDYSSKLRYDLGFRIARYAE